MGEPLSAQIWAGLTPNERETVREAARRDGRTVSNFIRHHILLAAREVLEGATPAPRFYPRQRYPSPIGLGSSEVKSHGSRL